MAVRYERWLIAKGSVFSPSSIATVKLVERLYEQGWIRRTSGVAIRTVDNVYGGDERARNAASIEPLPAALSPDWLDRDDRDELRMVWSVDGGVGSPRRYPLSLRPSGDATYAIELHRAPDYVYPTSPAIGAIATHCACGEDLAFDWDHDEVVPTFRGSTGIFAECEMCGRTFDPAASSAVVTHPFDGSTESIRGGAAYRFALKVDCGTCFVRDPHLAFAPELVAELEDEFGREFLQIGALGS